MDRRNSSLESIISYGPFSRRKTATLRKSALPSFYEVFCAVTWDHP